MAPCQRQWAYFHIISVQPTTFFYSHQSHCRFSNSDSGFVPLSHSSPDHGASHRICNPAKQQQTQQSPWGRSSGRKFPFSLLPSQRISAVGTLIQMELSHLSPLGSKGTAYKGVFTVWSYVTKSNINCLHLHKSKLDILFSQCKVDLLAF